jgi:GH15 family glucan-1,4-alpha-glucosidase
MSTPIEDYALIGDTHTAALVSREGSVDWLCVPRFDSQACFAALLGDDSHGRWLIRPSIPVTAVRRRYRDTSLVLETEMDTEAGTIRLTDTMPPREDYPVVVRLVEGVSGTVPMHMDLTVRFDYGSTVPWVSQVDGSLQAIAGPDALSLWSQVDTHGEHLRTVARFDVSAGQEVPFELAWYPSHARPPRPLAARWAIDDTERFWQEWSAGCTYEGAWRQQVLRSLVTLKALTYAPTGGIVAAPTTSLPESLGGNRNWDYRYCWLRDATLTLMSLLGAGFHDEARCWRDWLLRAVAGDVSKIQIMYGAAGERRLDEWEVPWLPGYEKSAPVRVGNAAAGQFQLDVYGEVMDALHQARCAEVAEEKAAWDLQLALMDFVAQNWSEPDDGIWEVRGPRRHFTHSKVMAWVAVDRAIQAVEQFPLEGPVDEWRALRQRIHEEVCQKGWNEQAGAFTQYYGAAELDASVLMIPLVGFLPPDDPRVISTVKAVEDNLVQDGFVLRYQTRDDASVDGLTGREGAFLACSFWLVDNYAMMGRPDEAQKLFDRLVGCANDLGLLSEEYDPIAGRLVGNFPQAFSHIALVNSARNLTSGGAAGRARHRGRAGLTGAGAQGAEAPSARRSRSRAGSLAPARAFVASDAPDRSPAPGSSGRSDAPSRSGPGSASSSDAASAPGKD